LGCGAGADGGCVFFEGDVADVVLRIDAIMPAVVFEQVAGGGFGVVEAGDAGDGLGGEDVWGAPRFPDGWLLT